MRPARHRAAARSRGGRGMSAAASTSEVDRIVAARRGGRYARRGCGQAGQLARGPHAPPAAATLRMGTARHGAREMRSATGDLRGFKPEDALREFCSDVAPLPSMPVPRGASETWEPSQREAERVANHVRREQWLYALLSAGKLIASGFLAGDMRAPLEDVLPHMWGEAARLRTVDHHLAGRLLLDEAAVNGMHFVGIRIRHEASFIEGRVAATASNPLPEPQANAAQFSGRARNVAIEREPFFLDAFERFPRDRAKFLKAAVHGLLSAAANARQQGLPFAGSTVAETVRHDARKWFNDRVAAAQTKSGE